MAFLVFQVGCIECGVSSYPIKVCDTLAEARAVSDAHPTPGKARAMDTLRSSTSINAPKSNSLKSSNPPEADTMNDPTRQTGDCEDIQRAVKTIGDEIDAEILAEFEDACRQSTPIQDAMDRVTAAKQQLHDAIANSCYTGAPARWIWGDGLQHGNVVRVLGVDRVIVRNARTGAEYPIRAFWLTPKFGGSVGDPRRPK